ncbi:cupin domain-containing protein [Rhodococcus sp. 077-4]|uniref:cupin domain-containing protein n=1 Tax=Rhodococcus sp. 077-4 TaxID=2789271 RepID=UPI0039F5CD56
MTTSTIEAVRLGDIALEASPIEPTWILEGSPQARVAQWSESIDGTTTTNVWDCTAGRFRWYFSVDEIVHIMDGSVTVSSEEHAPRTLVAGDAALFRAGTWSEWHVESYVRKHAILRQHLPAPVSFALKVAGVARARMGKFKTAVGGKRPQRVGSL